MSQHCNTKNAEIFTVYCPFVRRTSGFGNNNNNKTNETKPKTSVLYFVLILLEKAF